MSDSERRPEPGAAPSPPQTSRRPARPPRSTPSGGGGRHGPGQGPGPPATTRAPRQSSARSAPPPSVQGPGRVASGTAGVVAGLRGSSSLSLRTPPGSPALSTTRQHRDRGVSSSQAGDRASEAAGPGAPSRSSRTARGARHAGISSAHSLPSRDHAHPTSRKASATVTAAGHRGSSAVSLRSSPMVQGGQPRVHHAAAPSATTAAAAPSAPSVPATHRSAAKPSHPRLPPRDPSAPRRTHATSKQRPNPRQRCPQVQEMSGQARPTAPADTVPAPPPPPDASDGQADSAAGQADQPSSAGPQPSTTATPSQVPEAAASAAGVTRTDSGVQTDADAEAGTASRRHSKRSSSSSRKTTRSEGVTASDAAAHAPETAGEPASKSATEQPSELETEPAPEPDDASPKPAGDGSSVAAAGGDDAGDDAKRRSSADASKSVQDSVGHSPSIAPAAGDDELPTRTEEGSHKSSSRKSASGKSTSSRKSIPASVSEPKTEDAAALETGSKPPETEPASTEENVQQPSSARSKGLLGDDISVSCTNTAVDSTSPRPEVKPEVRSEVQPASTEGSSTSKPGGDAAAEGVPEAVAGAADGAEEGTEGAQDREKGAKVPAEESRESAGEKSTTSRKSLPTAVAASGSEPKTESAAALETGSKAPEPELDSAEENELPPSTARSKGLLGDDISVSCTNTEVGSTVPRPEVRPASAEGSRTSRPSKGVVGATEGVPDAAVGAADVAEEGTEGAQDGEAGGMEKEPVKGPEGADRVDREHDGTPPDTSKSVQDGVGRSTSSAPAAGDDELPTRTARSKGLLGDDISVSCTNTEVGSTVPRPEVRPASTQGSTTSTPSEGVVGAAEGELEGEAALEHGVPQVGAEEASEPAEEEAAQGAPVVGGALDVAPSDALEGAPEPAGAAEGSPEQEGVPEGTPEGTLEGAPEGAPPEEAPEGLTEPESVAGGAVHAPAADGSKAPLAKKDIQGDDTSVSCTNLDGSTPGAEHAPGATVSSPPEDQDGVEAPMDALPPEEKTRSSMSQGAVQGEVTSHADQEPEEVGGEASVAEAPDGGVEKTEIAGEGSGQESGFVSQDTSDVEPAALVEGGEGMAGAAGVGGEVEPPAATVGRPNKNVLGDDTSISCTNQKLDKK